MKIMCKVTYRNSFRGNVSVDQITSYICHNVQTLLSIYAILQCIECLKRLIRCLILLFQHKQDNFGRKW